MKLLPLVASLFSLCIFACTKLDSARTRRMPEADLFEPQRTPVRPEVPGRRNLDVRLPDGNVLRGILSARPEPKFNIVYFGGGSEIAQAAATRMAQWAARYDANVAFVDYRGYGASSGAPSLQTLPSDALPVFDRMSGMSGGIPTFVVGFALGSIPATYLAARRPVAGLVLVAPVSSPDDEDMYLELSKRKSGEEPWYLAHFLPHVKTKPDFVAMDDSKPMLQIRHVSVPLLLVHGEADGTVPPQCGRKVYEAAPGSRTLLLVPGAGHDVSMLLGGPGAEALARFMSECLGTEINVNEDILVEDIGGERVIFEDIDSSD
jgi:pimeloyl-ACP methyl ester carboxylesterase